jgi:serine protease Do
MRRPGIVLLVCLLLTACNRNENRNASGASAGRMAPGQNISGHIEPAGNIVSYADTVDRVAPAVVTVRSAKRVRAPQQFPFMNDPFFGWLFGGGQQSFGGQRPPVEEEHALGSGVIVRPDGYILTNDHVIDGAEEISVDLVDRRTFKAKLVGADKPSDLAVLKIEANNLPVLPLGNSDQVRVGDVCLAVGNPLGIGETVTEGIISAKGRQTDLSDGSFEDFLQTDAPINQGNSGGALVNTRGELIGINSQILSPNGGNIGIGFAIPSNMAKTVMEQLIAHGKVSRGQLGVTVQYINSDLAASLGLKQVQGVLVSSVQPGGPADKAGIKQGDVILQFNGAAVNDVNTLRNEVASAGAGAEVTLTILRDGKQQQIRVKLGEFNPNATASMHRGGEGGGAPSGRLGIQATPVTPDVAAQLGISRNTQGLAVIAVDPSGPAANAGIQQGDVIQQINHQPVRNANDVSSALAKSDRRPALVQVLRGGQSLFIAVPLK